MDQVYTPKQNYKVWVKCTTYNQSKYIEDALNGFAMQKTDFPFVCLVMDDASTDGEQEVIKAWMERECDMEKAEYVGVELSNIILVPHIHNANCFFAFYFLKRNLWKERELKNSFFTPWREHCEYEAICEGDDLWISPNKLSMQYKFMKANPDYVMCSHNAVVIEEGSWYRSFNTIPNDRELSLEECINSWIIPTASLFVSTSVLNTTFPWNNRPFFSGDQCIITTCAVTGRVYMFGEYMSIYRHYSSSAASTVKNLRGGRVYVVTQLIELFEAINSGTGYKYQEIFDAKIQKLKKEKLSIEKGGFLYRFNQFKSKCVLKTYEIWRKFIKPENIISHVTISDYLTK